MVGRRGTRIVDVALQEKKAADDSLERSLRPLWGISYYGCVLFDWCCKIPNKSRSSVVLHYIGISASVFILTTSTVFQSTQLVLEMAKPNSTIHSVIPNLIWFCDYPAALLTALTLLVRRTELLSFFTDWARLEQQAVLIPNKIPYERLYRFLYWCYGNMTLGLLGGIFLIVLIQMEASYLLSHYPLAVEILSFYGVIALQLVSVLFGWFFVTLADLVPSWTFYHAGRLLESLSLEFQDYCLKLPTGVKTYDLQRLFNRYEKVSKLTDRANQLFGWMILVNQIVLFFMNCVLIYTVLSTLREPDWMTLIIGSGTFVYSFRLVTTNLLTARLVPSHEKLKNSVLTLLISKSIGPEDKKLFTLFSHRMNNPMAAKPLGLYHIGPSTLVTIASLTVSYVIVLLQSK